MTYRHPGTAALLDDVDLSLSGGEVVLVSGISGAGKSTLLHLLSGLLRPTAGEILADQEPISRWLTSHRDRWRRRVGIIFQQEHLAAELSVLENVMLPLIPRSGGPRRWRAQSREILSCLDVGHLAGAAIASLSGGQRQRVAVARALVDAPDYIMADEPAAHQDEANARRIGSLLRKAADRGAVVVVAGHDRQGHGWIAIDRHLILSDGKLRLAS
jgi:ABC-type lipoprotein export system ATPase subunit